ncbi:hypothetical protein SAMN05660909_04191 [Chitinophaga terrae (ex Kim and Jung 2007)]|uniref:Uncharacterized protein n=1 Tax=Chitinophaga terrae (ex Kim and Jung 2007) TaxID=408074 RepID=A0A1H4F6U8_9BACT|nr:hypothetical protein SAMN05660909_04191 [Chitinophaga terrae (ex Kim and Jung 2007)]
MQRLHGWKAITLTLGGPVFFYRESAEVIVGRETSHLPKYKGKDGRLTDKLKDRMLEWQRNLTRCITKR